MSDNRLTHDERLRGEIRVNELFLSGESFIAYHVLHRLREPRHPPCALAYF